MSEENVQVWEEGAPPFVVIPEFREMFGEQPDEEWSMDLLEQSVEQDGILDAVIVAVFPPGTVPEGDRVLIDGHRRVLAAQAADRPIPYRDMEFENVDFALAWVTRHQLERRNLTGDAQSVYRSRLVEFVMESGGMSRGAARAVVAEEQGVSERTVRRDEDRADVIEKAKEHDLTEEQSEELASVPKSERTEETIETIKETGSAPPREKKRQVERPEPGDKELEQVRKTLGKLRDDVAAFNSKVTSKVRFASVTKLINAIDTEMNSWDTEAV